MIFIMPVLFLSCGAVLAMSIIATVIHGLVQGHVYYAPNSPPIDFKSHPVRFAVCIVIALSAASVCVLGSAKAAHIILKNL